ncbi:MATE family efflux transporter [Candidatus Mycoplasma mahonii]|uniref:MATE family efflux transporter n=1 Tax=Candidatus Mycoplasma mahonii TaxID=3004105 RepID=UPI0026EAD95B|nr:MATE family efflux transporter [Candidatus Mycoplasma mahonii]WKX02359.1 MATE family efflux transporter [Candidatus Mycoplasma mahonii]
MIKKLKMTNFNWIFFRQSLKILVPIVLSQVVVVAISFMDGIMVNSYERIGQPPKVDYAAVGIAGEIWFGFQAFFSATAIIFSILYSHFAHNQKTFTDVAKFNFWYSLVVTTVITLIMYFAASPIVNLFFLSSESTDSQIIKQIATNYLKIIALGHLFISFAWAMLNPLAIKGKAKYALYVSLVSLGLNIVFDYIFIYELDLGAEGSAWATTISYAVEFGIVTFFVWWHKGWFKGFWSTNIFIMNKFVVKEVLRRSWLFFTFVLMQVSIAASTFIYVNLYSTNIIKPMTVAYMVAGIMFSVFTGINRSVKIFIGTLLGEGKFEEARKTATKLWFSIVFLTSIFVVLALISTAFLPQAMLDSKSNIRVAKIMIYTFAGSVIAYTCAQYFSAILETSGFQLVPNLLNYFFHTWLVIPMIFILSYLGLGWSFEVNFIVCQCLYFIPAILIYFDYKRYKWLKRIKEY